MLGGIYKFGANQGSIPINYLGTWNASTNNPALASGVGTNGDMYVVNVAGTTTLDGISDWAVGDWVVFNGPLGVWQKIDNSDSWTQDTYGIHYSSGNIGLGTNSSVNRAIEISKSAATGILGVTTVGSFDLDFVGKTDATFDLIGQTAGVDVVLTAATSANIELSSGTGDSFIDLQSTSGSAYIYISPETAPGVATGKLYNVGGVLYWDGYPISAGASQWTADANGLTTTAFKLGVGVASSADYCINSTVASGKTGIYLRSDNNQCANSLLALGAVSLAMTSDNSSSSISLTGSTNSSVSINSLTAGQTASLNLSADTAGSAYVQIGQSTAPGTTTNRLYNLSGVLTWAGNAVAQITASGDGSGTQLTLKSPDGTDHYIRVSNDGEVRSA